MSKLDRIFLNRLARPITGRKFIVGDKRQAIYSFRGADIHSFDAFSNEPNTTILPLTVSYRCAKAIVRSAKEVYDEIEEFEENEEGVVREGSLKDIRDGDMVLCRNTRPLIEVFLQLIEMNVPAYVVGKDMEKGLLNILADLESETSTEIWINFKEGQKQRIVRELQAKGIKNPESNPRYDAFMEKLAILQILFVKFSTVGEVESFINDIFEDEYKDGAALMTIHKSKGLEADRVFVIRQFEGKQLIPSQYAVTEDQLVAERNLEFVAITRAKKELIFLDL
jgi:superfamily I DNA/RNA helicase